MPVNTPIVAVSGGTISETGETFYNGKYLKIETDHGYTVIYAHLNKIKVSENQRVEQGDVVALSGNTGMSSGPHLHYGVYKNGELLDPMEFIPVDDIEFVLPLSARN